MLAPSAPYTPPLLTAITEERSGPLGAQQASEEEPTDVTVSTLTYPTLNADGDRVGATRWRVVAGTGNCCENYLAATKDGKLLDFGGDFAHVSNDLGKTWTKILPAPLRLSGGEGAVAVAPGGDIVGMGWYLSTMPDQVVPFKYDASDERWYFTVTKLHQPFYDRPTIGVLPGPFTIAGQEVPYISVLRGGLGLVSKTPWFYSLDGLNYVVANSKLTDQVTGTPVRGWLDVPRWDELDWIQPHEQAGLAPLGRGQTLGVLPSIPDTFDETTEPLTIFDDKTMKWSSFSFPNESFEGPVYGGRFAVDSRGRLHYVLVDNEVVYKMSSDGGRHWTTAVAPLPDGFKMDSPYYASMKTNGRLGITAIAVHAVNVEGNAQDLVYKFATGSRTPRLQKIYLVGDGDLDTSAGITSTASARFDFPNIALLPGGRIALSFDDQRHRSPAIAIEIGPAH